MILTHTEITSNTTVWVNCLEPDTMSCSKRNSIEGNFKTSELPTCLLGICIWSSHCEVTLYIGTTSFVISSNIATPEHLHLERHIILLYIISFLFFLYIIALQWFLSSMQIRVLFRRIPMHEHRKNGKSRKISILQPLWNKRSRQLTSLTAHGETGWHLNPLRQPDIMGLSAWYIKKYYEIFSTYETFLPKTNIWTKPLEKSTT